MYVYKLTLNIGLGSEVSETLDLSLESDKSEEELNALTETELDNFVYAFWKEWAWNYIDGGVTLLPVTKKPPEPLSLYDLRKLMGTEAVERGASAAS